MNEGESYGVRPFLLAELKIVWGARTGTLTLIANIYVLINSYLQTEQYASNDVIISNVITALKRRWRDKRKNR